MAKSIHFRVQSIEDQRSLDHVLEESNAKRSIFGWPSFAITPDCPVHIAPTLPEESIEACVGPARFRVSTAREDKTDHILRISTRNGERLLGSCRVWCSVGPQPFEIELGPDVQRLLRTEGGRLSVEGGEAPLWLLGLAEGRGGDPTDRSSMHDYWCPRLSFDVPKTENAALRAERWLCSGAAMQSFGWRSGCLLDPLLTIKSLAARRAIEQQLAVFVDGDGKPLFDQWDNRYAQPEHLGAESGFPVASFLPIDTEHPFVSWAVEQWRSRLDAEGVYHDAGTTAAEGAYMTAYPMALVAAARGVVALLQTAVDQLHGRAKRLWDGKRLWLRWNDRRGLSLASWARGVAWHVLGFAKTLGVLPEDQLDDALLDHARTTIAWAFAHQREDGLWPNRFDFPQSAADTSSTAGIVASALLAVAQGWGDPALIKPALRGLEALDGYVDAHGMLHGCAPDNMIGEPLLRSDYRVIHPTGTGLFLTACHAAHAATSRTATSPDHHRQ